MKITLIFGRTETDNVSIAWTGIRKVDVEIPDDLPVVYDKGNPLNHYHLLGMVEQEVSE